MMRPPRWVIRLAWFSVLALGMATAVAAHSPEVIFRAYLTRTWWHPAQRDVRELMARLSPERSSSSWPSSFFCNGSRADCLPAAAAVWINLVCDPQ